MIEFLYQISAIFTTAAMLIAAAGWLASKFFENRINRDFESYKTLLKIETEHEIENLKSKLQITVKEREIANTWLHQKRADAIENLYISLVDLQNCVRIVLDIFSPRNPTDIRKYTSDAFDRTHEVYESYLKAKIFLTPQTCEIIERVLNGIQDPIAEYHLYLGVYDDHELNTLIGVKEQAWKQLQDNVRPALNTLEEEFRKVLGVHINNYHS